MVESMKFQQARIFLGSLALGGILLWSTGCGGGSQEGDKAHDSIDTPQVVKVEPQDFPVNDLPDSLFGKVPQVKAEPSLKVTPGALTETRTSLPEWLDQILSRESIVLFANGILGSLPEEVEFVQSSSIVHDAGDGLKAFVVSYTTRPSSASMVVYGGWRSEEQSYWASYSSKEKLEVKVEAAQATANGVELSGTWAEGAAKAVPFKTTIVRGSSTLLKGKG